MKKLRRIRYYVQSKHVSERLNKHYPLLKVEIEELQHPVVTVTGALGYAIQATISYPDTPKVEVWEDDVKAVSGMRDGRIVTANTVWHPSDTYSFSLGAKIALRRALDEWNAKEYTRKRAFQGLMAALRSFSGTSQDNTRLGSSEAVNIWEQTK